MRTLLLVGCVLGVTACASGGASGGGAELNPGSRVTTQTIVAGAGGASMAMNMVNDANAVGSVVNGTVDATWSALQSVYASLDIPLTFRDEAKKSLGNTSFRTRRRVGSVPMIRALDCGGESGMPNAETYDITLEITSLVQPEGEGKARLQTLVQATGRRPASGGGSDMRCTSLGGLEKKISEMVSAILAGK
jgi:hypothetical protein